MIRRAVLIECCRRVQDYLPELGLYYADKTNMVAKDRYKQAARRVRELMREEQELSAVARACVLSAGDPRAQGLLQSA